MVREAKGAAECCCSKRQRPLARRPPSHTPPLPPLPPPLPLCPRLTYWVVFAAFTALELFTDWILFWLPFYFSAKIALLVWLMHPSTRGAEILYKGYLRAIFVQYSGAIDNLLHSAAVATTSATAAVRTAAASALPSAAAAASSAAAAGASSGAGAMGSSAFASSSSVAAASAVQRSLQPRAQAAPAIDPSLIFGEATGGTHTD